MIANDVGDCCSGSQRESQASAMIGLTEQQTMTHPEFDGVGAR
jgi:hypothetical protein